MNGDINDGRITISLSHEEARVVQWALRRAVDHAGSNKTRSTAAAVDIAFGVLLSQGATTTGA